jgi:REP element-mobilizing transposase RayT
MGGVLRKSGCVAQAIGGVADHVHLLVGLPATSSLSQVVRELKTLSSKWIHEELGQGLFAWQEGYGAFTVSASQRETVRNYIENQEQHHRVRSFQDEYREFLDRCGVEYKEEHLW